MNKLLAPITLTGLLLLATHGNSQEPTCTTIADCAQKAMEAAFQAKLALEIATPKGAVMPFNLNECPKGWKLFEPASGRVIVGSGKGEGLSPREVGQKGGEEEHLLTVAEMPKHNHTPDAPFNQMVGRNNNATATALDEAGNELNLKSSSPMADAGGDAAHNIMQPFHVLLFCERN